MFLPTVQQTAALGHIHLRVRDVRQANRLYHDLLGFDVQSLSESIAPSLGSAGGYHHRVGSAGAPPPDDLAVRHFELVPPISMELRRVVDHIL